MRHETDERKHYEPGEEAEETVGRSNEIFFGILSLKFIAWLHNRLMTRTANLVRQLAVATKTASRSELLLNLLYEARVMREPQQGPREKKICIAASAHTCTITYKVSPIMCQPCAG